MDLDRFCDGLGLISYAAAPAQDGPDEACVEVGNEGKQLGVAVIDGDSPHVRGWCAGEFACLNLDPPEIRPAVRLSPKSTSSVLEAYSDGFLTQDRTVELLRGTLTAPNLPVLQPQMRDEALMEACQGHTR